MLRVFILSILLAASAYAGENDGVISSLICNGRALQLMETTRLTRGVDGTIVSASISPDGRYAAYVSEKDDIKRLSLLKLANGKRVDLLVETNLNSELNKPQPGQEFWAIEDPTVKWSPDSRLLSIAAVRLSISQNDESAEDRFILVFTVGGVRKAALPVPGTACNMRFSPGSQEIAAIISLPIKDPSAEERRCKLIVYNIANQSVREICERGGEIIVRGWADSGTSIVYVYNEGKAGKLVKQALNSKDEEVIATADDAKSLYSLRYAWSPDLRLNMVTDNSGVAIKPAGVQNAAEIVKWSKVSGVDWFPNSKLLFCSIPTVINDPANDAQQMEWCQLWVMSAEKHKENAMQITADADTSSVLPTASNDCTKIIYVSYDRLYLAEMEWRDLDAREKASAGIPLNEDDEKTLLMENAKLIGMATRMYAADWEDKYPSSDAIRDSLKPYFDTLDYDNLFLRPGTDQDIFRYLLPDGCKDADISNPSETPIGEFDAGYSWKVVLYADGHVKTVPK